MQENNLRKLAKFSFWFGCVILAILLPASCTNKNATTAIETIGSETVVTNTAPTDNPLIIGGYSTRYSLSWGKSTTYIPIIIGENRSSDLSGIEQLQNIRRLSITLMDTRDIDFIPLRSLSNLEFLEIGGRGLTTIPDLSDIPSLKILELRFGRLTNLNGIEKITSLENLDIYGNRERITDISAMRYLKKLKHLNFLNGFYNIDFSVLGYLPELAELSINAYGEFDLIGINQLKTLRRLQLTSNISKDIKYVRNEYKNIEEIGKITGLKELYLDESITSVEFLAGNVNLEELHLIADEERDDYYSVRLPLDVKPLSNLVNLKYLAIRGFELENADVLERLPKLERFYTELYSGLD
jgi:Leucine-rich repeat (LRR) protein